MDDLALAAELVSDAGRLAHRMLRQGLETKFKTSVSDVVSAADTAAEQLVGRRLHSDRPDDAVVGEEGTDRRGAPGSTRTWYVDPVDGTYNFLSGVPFWCSAVGLVEGEAAVAGAVYHPPVDELWLGGRGQPTTCNGVEVEPLADAPLARLSVASYLHPGYVDDPSVREPLVAVMREAATVRMLGSGSVELSYVAGGRLGAWVQANTLPWDWQPGVALVLAAGGAAQVLEHRGQRWHVAGNAEVVDQICGLLASA